MDQSILAEQLGLSLEEVKQHFRFAKAELSGYRRIFDVYRPQWDGLVLNLTPDPKATVVGILISGLSEKEPVQIDRIEGLSHERQEMTVRVGNQLFLALVYVGRTSDTFHPIAEAYEKKILTIVDHLGGEIADNYYRLTLDPKGQPRYKEK